MWQFVLASNFVRRRNPREKTSLNEKIKPSTSAAGLQVAERERARAVISSRWSTRYNTTVKKAVIAVAAVASKVCPPQESVKPTPQALQLVRFCQPGVQSKNQGRWLFFVVLPAYLRNLTSQAFLYPVSCVVLSMHSIYPAKSCQIQCILHIRGFYY